MNIETILKIILAVSLVAAGLSLPRIVSFFYQRIERRKEKRKQKAKEKSLMQLSMNIKEFADLNS